MADAKRIESRLNAAIKLAQDLYEDAKPISIWDSFYAAISQLPTQQQLLISGEALKELAQVTLLKSEAAQLKYAPDSSDSPEKNVLLENIPESAGAVLGEEWLAKIVLKTSSLDLSRFAKPETRLRLPGEEFFDEAVAAPDAIFDGDVIDSPEALDQVLAIAHSESVSDWQAAILSVLEVEAGPIDFWVLKSKTKLSSGALFLGLIFEDERWSLEQNASMAVVDGYGSILVSLDQSKRKNKE